MQALFIDNPQVGRCTSRLFLSFLPLMYPTRSWFVTLAALVTLACSASAATAPHLSATDPLAPRSPRLVIAGGALSAETAAVWQAFVEARHGSGPLCVLPTASGNPERSGASAAATLRRYTHEVNVRVLPLTTESAGLATQPGFAEELRACSGYWFVGGSQSRITDVFLPGGLETMAWQALHDRHAQGAVIGGSSAGAAMMSSLMIAGGSSREALDHGVATSPDGPGIDVRAGMRLFDAGVLDQHFLARGRIGRLLVTVLDHPEIAVGFGIDENTALVVEGDSVRVLGESGVIIVDGRAASGRGDEALHVWLAGSGDHFTLEQLTPTAASHKTSIPADGSAVAAPDDLFARWVFLEALVALARSSVTEVSWDAGNGASVAVTKAARFSAQQAQTNGGPEGTPAGLSLGPLEVRVQR